MKARSRTPVFRVDDRIVDGEFVRGLDPGRPEEFFEEISSELERESFSGDRGSFGLVVE